VAARGGREAIWREDEDRRVIFHTDRGSTYTAKDFRALCARLGVRQSMGRWGRVSIMPPRRRSSSLEWEVLSRNTFSDTLQAWAVVIDWCYTFYNHQRRHSAADGLPPVNYEIRKPTEAASGLRNPPRSRGNHNRRLGPRRHPRPRRDARHRLGEHFPLTYHAGAQPFSLTPPQHRTVGPTEHHAARWSPSPSTCPIAHHTPGRSRPTAGRSAPAPAGCRLKTLHRLDHHTVEIEQQ
jgi:hypothetical protein